MLDSVIVDHGRHKSTLPKIAQVSIRDSNTLMVSIMDSNIPSSVVESAIRATIPNVNPTSDGAIVKVPLPK